MRQSEYDEAISDWDELISYAGEVEYWDFDIRDHEEASSLIDDEISDYIRHHSWEDLRDELNNIDLTNGEYFEWRGAFDFVDVTDFFDDYKEALHEYCDLHHKWDDEDDDDEEHDEYDEDEDKLDENEDDVFSLSEFLMVSPEVA